LVPQPHWVFQANLGLNSPGTSSGSGPLLKLGSTLPQGRVIVAFLETSTGHQASASHEPSDSPETGDDNGSGDDTHHGKGKNNDHRKSNNNNLFTATANGSALFEMAPVAIM